MALPTFQEQFFESSRGRIVGLLRRRRLTVDELAAALELTANAVRAQLAVMERDGLVRRSGVRRGATRPAHLYELTPEIEHLLSRAYIPLLAQLLRVVAEREPAAEFDALMRAAGRGLADELPVRVPPPDTPLAERAASASRLLNEELGALTELERLDGRYVIRGHGCPLGALTHKHPGVCRAIESLLTQWLGAQVHECCDRHDRPRCCFEIASPRPPAPAASA